MNRAASPGPKRPRAIGCATAALATVAAVGGLADPGKDYAARCAACHDKPADAKTPGVEALKRMNSTRVRHAVVQRNMRQHVQGLDRFGVEALPGVLAVDDLVIVPSGYGMFGQMPGNVLLVFELGARGSGPGDGEASSADADASPRAGT